MSGAARPAPSASARPGSKQRLRLWIRLLRTTRAIEAEVRERLRVQFAMTLPQFDVMAALYRVEGGLTMTELSRKLMVSNGNVTGIVDRLTTERYVLRQAPANDRRSFIVRLTPRGTEHFATVAAAHEQWIYELLSEFDASELDGLIDHFDGLAGRIRKGGRRS